MKKTTHKQIGNHKKYKKFPRTIPTQETKENQETEDLQDIQVPQAEEPPILKEDRLSPGQQMIAQSLAKDYAKNYKATKWADERDYVFLLVQRLRKHFPKKNSRAFKPILSQIDHRGRDGFVNEFLACWKKPILVENEKVFEWVKKHIEKKQIISIYSDGDDRLYDDVVSFMYYLDKYHKKLKHPTFFIGQRDLARELTTPERKVTKEQINDIMSMIREDDQKIIRWTGKPAIIGIRTYEYEFTGYDLLRNA